MSRPTPHRSVLVLTLETVLLAVASAAAWWGWLGWDHTYYVDSRTGYPAGPYRPWQVVGCVLTLLLIGAIAYRRLPALVVGVTVTLSFTIAYASSTVPGDETGLSGVGVVMVFIGTAFATTVLGLVAVALRYRSRT